MQKSAAVYLTVLDSCELAADGVVLHVAEDGVAELGGLALVTTDEEHLGVELKQVLVVELAAVLGVISGIRPGVPADTSRQESAPEVAPPYFIVSLRVGASCRIVLLSLFLLSFILDLSVDDIRKTPTVEQLLVFRWLF